MVLGAELGRRLKKREREGDRESGLSRKQLSLETLRAQCPRPDPAGRSAAPVLRLPPWRGRRKLAGHWHCGGDQRALLGSYPRRVSVREHEELCPLGPGATRAVVLGSDAGGARQAIW